MRGRYIKLYDEDQDLLEDVLIEIKQAIEMSNIYLNILSGTMDAFASVISNNLNIVMKVLASITLIISIPTVISGLYGMNVQNLPLAQFWWFPVLLSLGLMGIAGFILKKPKCYNLGGKPMAEQERGRVLYLVIPCYNEEEVLPETSKRLTAKFGAMIERGLISQDSKIVFVNDGSKDHTWQLIRQYHEENPMIQGINLSRNKGHQNALLAGLMTVKEYCDMAISMDADLQDDVDAIDQFVEKYYEGCEVVYGVRSERKTDSLFKRASAQGFYKLMLHMGVEIVYNHADYRLMSRRALDEMEGFKEVNLFLRGIVPLIGFQSGVVTYERHERFAGESKYPLKKMLNFAFDGITSFSVKPIRMVTTLGIIIFAISILMLIYFLITWCIGWTVPGWTSIVVSVWAIGGLQLLAIGIIGEYIGKIYMETKARPKFIVQEYLK